MSNRTHELMIEKLSQSISKYVVEGTRQKNNKTINLQRIDYQYTVNGKLHRTDGPAKYTHIKRWEDGVLLYNYTELRSYYVNGNKVSKAYFKKKYGCE